MLLILIRPNFGVHIIFSLPLFLSWKSEELASGEEAVSDGCCLSAEFRELDGGVAAHAVQGQLVDCGLDREHEVVPSDDEAAAHDDESGVENVYDTRDSASAGVSDVTYSVDGEDVFVLHGLKDLIQGDISLFFIYLGHRGCLSLLETLDYHSMES